MLKLSLVMWSEREPLLPGIEPKELRAAFTSPQVQLLNDTPNHQAKQPEHSASERRKKEVRLSPASRNRRGRRFALVVLGIDDDVTLRGFALAFGAKVLEITQGEVKDAAFARRHGTERVRHAGFAD